MFCDDVQKKFVTFAQEIFLNIKLIKNKQNKFYASK